MNNEKKKVTMNDIAKKLNISINAVSLALNNKAGISEKMRQKVLKTADELGYLDTHPALIKKNHMNNICMMIEEKNFKDTRFYSSVILGIQNEAKKNDYDIIACFIDKNDHSIPSSIEQGKVSGIAIVGSIEDDYLEKVSSYGLPIILVDNASFSINTDAVLTQNTPGSFMATKYLIENGHNEIGFFGEKYLTLSFNERWIGYNEAMRKHKLTVHDEFCLTDSIEEYAINNDYKSAAEVIRGMKKLPTAWVCANDSAAVVLVNALTLLGLNVPQDISVVGFDDIDLCKIISPKLTTIKVNKSLMGALAIRNLLWRMENLYEPKQHIRMAVELIERDSVRRLEHFSK